MLQSVGLLFLSNVFMTFAWYGHLKNLKGSPLWIAIAVSWGIALLEYCFQVPANRIGSNYFTLSQLKIIQEVVTLIVFAGFTYWYMGTSLSRNFLYASLCMVAAVYFIFQEVQPA